MNEKRQIKVICAYCGALIGVKEGEGIEGVSHGICRKCLITLFPDLADTGEKSDAPPLTGEHASADETPACNGS